MNNSDQFYDSSLLLGALLRITGLSIFELQNIIQGNLLLSNKHENIKSLILEGSIWRTTFCSRLAEETKAMDVNIILNDLNAAFKTTFGLNELNTGIYDLGFYFNCFNFSLSNSFEIRERLIELFKSNKYNFSENKIAKILDISPTTVGKIVKELTQKK